MAINSIHVTKSDELSDSTGQTGGMIRKGAIAELSDKLNANIMIAHAHTASAIHHHGDQDTVVYVKSGHGAISFNNGQETKRLDPGDFCLIPAGVEHQEINDSDEDIEWVIVRSGTKPAVVNLEGWGASEKTEAPNGVA